MKTILSACTIVLITSIPATARCVVTDPTSTPLNIRASPNGQIVGNLRNGDTVVIQAVVFRGQGRPWANIGGGWVFREFISCY
jgi:hypothetical protein